MKARYLLPICALALSVPMFANMSNDDEGKTPPTTEVYNQDINIDAQAADLSLNESNADEWRGGRGGWGGRGWGGRGWGGGWGRGWGGGWGGRGGWGGYGLGWGGYGLGWGGLYGSYWPYYSYVYPSYGLYY